MVSAGQKSFQARAENSLRSFEGRRLMHLGLLFYLFHSGEQKNGA